MRSEASCVTTEVREISRSRLVPNWFTSLSEPENSSYWLSTLRIASYFFEDNNLYRALLILVIKSGFILEIALYIASGIKESTLGKDCSVPLMHHDPSDLGLICLEKKHKIRFRI